MAVKAIFFISDMFNYGVGTVGVRCYGKSTDDSVDFTGNVNGAIGVGGLDWSSATLTTDIEDAVKTTLQNAPYSMTFAGGDTVKLIPG